VRAPKAAAGIGGVDGIARSLSLPEQHRHRPDRGYRQTGRTGRNRTAQQQPPPRQAYTTPGLVMWDKETVRLVE